MSHTTSCFLFFFFNDTATTEIYTLSLHDALPISRRAAALRAEVRGGGPDRPGVSASRSSVSRDRKSTRLNSSHGYISYAVFCLKKKKKQRTHTKPTMRIETHLIRETHAHPTTHSG